MEATFKFTIFLSQKSGEKSIRKTQWASMLIMFSELIIQRSTITKDFTSHLWLFKMGSREIKMYQLIFFLDIHHIKLKLYHIDYI